MKTVSDVMRRYPLASKTGIELMIAMLLHEGAMCPKCGYATRVTSKRWARCKKCGERVFRKPITRILTQVPIRNT